MKHKKTDKTSYSLYLLLTLFLLVNRIDSFSFINANTLLKFTKENNQSRSPMTQLYQPIVNHSNSFNTNYFPNIAPTINGPSIYQQNNTALGTQIRYESEQNDVTLGYNDNRSRYHYGIANSYYNNRSDVVQSTIIEDTLSKEKNYMIIPTNDVETHELRMKKKITAEAIREELERLRKEASGSDSSDSSQESDSEDDSDEDSESDSELESKSESSSKSKKKSKSKSNSKSKKKSKSKTSSKSKKKSKTKKKSSEEETYEEDEDELYEYYYYEEKPKPKPKKKSKPKKKPTPKRNTNKTKPRTPKRPKSKAEALAALKNTYKNSIGTGGSIGSPSRAPQAPSSPRPSRPSMPRGPAPKPKSPTPINDRYSGTTDFSHFGGGGGAPTF